MIQEYHGDTLYRLEYLPTVLIPILFALIDSNISIFKVILPIFGWCFLAIGGFLMNDVIDKDRNLELGHRSLLILCLLCLMFGFYLIGNHSFYFALLFTILGVLYNWKLKFIPVFKNVFLVALVGLPYLAFTNNVHILTILAFCFLGLFAEFTHSLADKDATFQYLQKKTLYLAFFASLCFLIFSSINIIFADPCYFVPLSIIALFSTIGFLLIWNKPGKWPTVKKLGTEIFKLFTLYLLIILLFK